MATEQHQITENIGWKLVNARNKLNQHKIRYQKMFQKSHEDTLHLCPLSCKNYKNLLKKKNRKENLTEKLYKNYKYSVQNGVKSLFLLFIYAKFL